MVGDLKSVLLDQLPRIAWMDEATRNRARDKLNSITDRLAYPEELLDDVKMNALFEKVPYSSTTSNRSVSIQYCTVHSSKVQITVHKRALSVPSQLNIVNGDYFQNVLNVAAFERWYFSLLLSESPAENPLEDWKVDNNMMPSP